MIRGESQVDLREYLQAWLEANELDSASEINAGLCEEFALELAELLPDADVVYTEDYVEWGSDQHPGGHAWVRSGGLFYDAECLEGVACWEDLPFFARRRAPPGCDAGATFSR